MQLWGLASVKSAGQAADWRPREGLMCSLNLKASGDNFLFFEGPQSSSLKAFT